MQMQACLWPARFLLPSYRGEVTARGVEDAKRLQRCCFAEKLAVLEREGERYINCQLS